MPKIDALLDELMKRGGTDLHLGDGYPPLTRVRGELLAMREGAIDAKELEELIVELLSPEQQTRLRDTAKRLKNRGVNVLLSNSSAPFVRRAIRSIRGGNETVPR